MNILLVSQNVALGGAQRVVIQLAHNLENFGHRVYVFSPHLDLQKVSKVASKLNYISPDIPILKKAGPSYKMLDNPFHLALSLWKLRRALKRTVRQFGIDIINAHNPPSQWIASFLAIPAVWSCNEPIALWPSMKKEYFPLNIEPPTLLQKGMECLYEIIDYFIVHRGISQIVTLSQRTRSDVQSLYHRDAEICRAGVDFSFFAEGDGESIRRRHSLENTYIFLQTGHFNYEKNQKCSVEAYALFKKRVSQRTKLIFIGDGPLKEEIEHLAAALGLSNDIVFPGRVDEETLRDYYHACDCLLFPAFNQSWGLTPFEVMAAGKIAIVSDDCGASEVIGERGIGYVTSPKPENFSGLMEYVYHHPEECRKKIIEGRKYVQEHLTYERYSQKMLNIFDGLLRKRQNEN